MEYKCECCGARLTEDEIEYLYGDTYMHYYQIQVDDVRGCGPVYKISEMDDGLNPNPG